MLRRREEEPAVHHGQPVTLQRLPGSSGRAAPLKWLGGRLRSHLIHHSRSERQCKRGEAADRFLDPQRAKDQKDPHNLSYCRNTSSSSTTSPGKSGVATFSLAANRWIGFSRSSSNANRESSHGTGSMIQSSFTPSLA